MPNTGLNKMSVQTHQPDLFSPNSGEGNLTRSFPISSAFGQPRYHDLSIRWVLERLGLGYRFNILLREDVKV